MRNEGADPEHALLEADLLERQLRDIDQQLGLGQAHVQRRDETLPAREHLRAGALHQLERLRERTRLGVGE